MKILYYVMTHRNPKQIDRLVDRLSSSQSAHTLVHHDARSPQLVPVKHNNVSYIPQPIEVKWGEMSVVHAMWLALDWIDQQRLSFDWLIFLSGQDYPTRPLASIEAELKKSAVDAYVESERVTAEKRLGERYFQLLCRRRYLKRRIKLPGVKPWYINRSHPYKNGFHCYAGSQWLNLSRRAIDSLRAQRNAARALMKYLKNVPCPDETVFHTLLLNDPHLTIENSSKRFILWENEAPSPTTLTTRHLEAILSSDSWFARKVDPALCPELLEKLDSQLA